MSKVMRVLNQKGETITEYDLITGNLYPFRTIKEDAKPIDGVTKFAYTPEDYEDALIYIPNKEKTAAEKIAELKKKLTATDYKVIKCSECQLLGQEMPYDVAELHTERQAIRDEINRLEQEA